MFVRKKHNKSGSVSVQIIDKKNGYKVVQTVGSSADELWDGLKGYVTNTRLSAQRVAENYVHLWQIEKAFRISKTDLKVRPVYHYQKRRIESHICISFVAYSIYKEMEYLLKKHRIPTSPKRAAELTHTIYYV